jgi:hypothetical protein
MKKVFILFTILLISSFIWAQNFIEPQFGQLSQEEIDMAACTFDSTANAVVLFDVGKTEFVRNDNAFDIRFTQHKRIKIFNKKGFESGTIEIPFFVDEKGVKEEVKSIKAFTYIVKDGEINKIPLDQSTVYTEKLTQRWHLKKFVFPNLKDGAILEYSYELNSPFIFNLHDWEFQSSIPTLHSQYEVATIPFYEYVQLSQGLDSLLFQETVKSKTRKTFRGIEYKDLIYRSSMKNIEAFVDESYITSRNDYIKKFDYQLSKVHNPDGTRREVIPSWEKLNRELLYYDEFGKYIKGCKRFAKEALTKIDLSNKSKAEKIETLINYVKRGFYWDGMYGIYASQSPKSFYSKKSGNIGDINLFLLALLDEAGINADPLIISTRGHGKLSLKYPIRDQFNYVLVFVNDGDQFFLADGTNPHTSYLMIPTKCINDYGLVVNKDKAGKWLKIQYNQASLKRNIMDITIDPDEKKCHVFAELNTNFYEAFDYRDTYKNDTMELKEAFERNFDEVYKIKTRNYEDPALEYQIYYEAEKELSWLNDFILIKPFFGLALTENLLEQDKRDYPVDMLYPEHNQFKVNITMPENYTIDNMPEFFFLDDDLVFVSFSAMSDNLNKNVMIMGEYKFKKAIYEPTEYALLKAHMDSIVEVFNVELVLKQNTTED